MINVIVGKFGGAQSVLRWNFDNSVAEFKFIVQNKLENGWIGLGMVLPFKSHTFLLQMLIQVSCSRNQKYVL